MIYCHYIIQNVHLLHDRESNMFLKNLPTTPRISLCNLPFCPPYVFDHCVAFFISHLHHRIRSCSDVVDVTWKYILQRKNFVRHVISRQLISGTTPRVISDFVLFLPVVRKGYLQKALTLKWMQMTMCISWYTRRPRNEAISISFIMQLLLRISFRSFLRQKDILSRSFFYVLMLSRIG